MKNELIAEALNELSDKHIDEAAKISKKRPWLGAVAAVLAAAILTCVIWEPLSGSRPQEPEDPQATQTSETPTHSAAPGSSEAVQLAHLIAEPEYPKMALYPTGHDSNQYDSWWENQREMHNQPNGYADNLEGYFSSVLSQLMTDTDGENATCSPVNIYMALAMLAETTDGNSRQQLLDLLNADSITALREQAQHVWKAHYQNDGLSTSILANSLWLEEGYIYNEDTVQLLSGSYYASVFQGDLGSEEMNRELQAWLDQQTGGLLREQVQNTKLDPSSVLALASTLYYQVQWQERFFEEKNTQATFHGTAGDTEETFMNKQLSYGPYYWSDNFGAVSLYLEDSSRMWLILPDEGVTPEALISSGEAMDFLAQDPAAYQSQWQNQKSIIVNLSVPKFDISADMELSEQLKALGVTDIFTPGTADFSPIIPEADGGWVSRVKHATRVAIDEVGVTAAAFTVIDRCGAAMPPEEEIDFTLDRPFLFIIESQDGLPLFAGIVNQP